jgi:hypothetical protein
MIKLQWKQPTSPKPKKTHMSKSQIKTMLITFFHIKGIVHCEFIPQGQTVNQTNYEEIFKWFVNLCIEKGLNFGLIGFSIITVLQLKRHFLLAQKLIPEMELLAVSALEG